MKLLTLGAGVAALSIAVATPVLAAQSDDKPHSPATPTTSAHPDEKAGDQGRESSARGRAHRDAMHAWQKCVREKSKASCEKPAPPGLAKGHAKGAAAANKHGKGHASGKGHAPGQDKTQHPEAD